VPVASEPSSRFGTSGRKLKQRHLRPLTRTHGVLRRLSPIHPFIKAGSISNQCCASQHGRAAVGIPFRFGLAAATLISAASIHANAAVFASGYVASQTSGLNSGYNDPTKALGGPTLMTDVGTSFQSVVSPFNPAYAGTDIVGIGGGGQLTLQFPNEVTVGAGNEIGVFAYAFLVDSDGLGDNYNPAQIYGPGQASVYVSNDGSNWLPISGAPIAFNSPYNAYTDATGPYQSTPGSHVADFGVPFAHVLSDFNGKTFAQTLALFGTSGGGTWLSLSSSGLSEVDYIQFRVPQGSTLNIDAVSINNNAVGAAVPEPASFFGVGASLFLLKRRR